MKIFFAGILFTGCFLILGIRAQAQILPEPALDSLEHRILVDSLQVSDSLASVVQLTGRQFVEQVQLINSDSTMSPSIKKLIIRQQADFANRRVKRLLGQALFDQYKAIIQRHMHTLRPGEAIDPLANAY